MGQGVRQAVSCAGVLSALLTSTAAAQSRWVVAAQAGYAASTENDAGGLGGGSFAGSVFIGRELGRLFVLGIEGGYYQVRKERRITPVDCFPSTPGSLGCTSDRRDKSRWIQPAVALRVGPNAGEFRPYGLVGLGGYSGEGQSDIDVTSNTTGQSELNYPSFSTITSRALGASLGGGLDWAPNDGPWSLGVSARLHWLVGGTNTGEYGGSKFVTLMGGAGYRW
jgi:hypothetical protein